VTPPGRKPGPSPCDPEAAVRHTAPAAGRIFIADMMLGKLAKWMRILGYDVEYFPEIGDEELIERAEATGRLILTRDTLLVRRRKVRGRHCFVRGDDWRDQLRQVVAAFPSDLSEQLLSRCLRCNAPLAEVPREEVRGKVPPYVYETREEFATCPSCGRIYWGATHRDKVTEHLREILG
jgi:uncharacterized protein